MNDLNEICDAAYHDAADVAKEVRKKGSLISSGMLEAADKLAHTIKSIETVNAMKNAEDEDSYRARMYREGRDGRSGGGRSGGYREGGYSEGGYRRGGYGDDGYRDDDSDWYRARRRDSRGRYRDDGEEVADKLHEAMEMAPDEKSREAIRRAMEQVRK